MEAQNRSTRGSRSRIPKGLKKLWAGSRIAGYLDAPALRIEKSALMPPFDYGVHGR